MMLQSVAGLVGAAAHIPKSPSASQELHAFSTPVFDEIAPSRPAHRPLIDENALADSAPPAERRVLPTPHGIIHALYSNGKPLPLGNLLQLLALVRTRRSMRRVVAVFDSARLRLAVKHHKPFLLAVAQHKLAPRTVLSSLIGDPASDERALYFVASNPRASASILDAAARHPNARQDTLTAVIRHPNTASRTVLHLFEHLYQANYPANINVDELGKAIACTTHVSKDEILKFAANARARPFLVGLCGNSAWDGLTEAVLKQGFLSIPQLNRVLNRREPLPLALKKRVFEYPSIKANFLARALQYHYDPKLFTFFHQHKAMTLELRQKLYDVAAYHPETNASHLRVIATAHGVHAHTIAKVAEHANAGADLECFIAILNSVSNDKAMSRAFFTNVLNSPKSAPAVITAFMLAEQLGDADRIAAIFHPAVTPEMLSELSAQVNVPAGVTSAAWVRMGELAHDGQQPGRAASSDSEAD